MASISMGVWGWWSFDIFTLMATYISPSAAAAQTIMRSIGLLTFMMPVGFANGAAIMIGKSAGKEQKLVAMQYYRIALQVALFLTFVQVLILLVFRDFIIAAYTSNDAIAENISYAWPILCLFTVFDTL